MPQVADVEFAFKKLARLAAAKAWAYFRNRLRVSASAIQNDTLA